MLQYFGPKIGSGLGWEFEATHLENLARAFFGGHSLQIVVIHWLFPLKVPEIANYRGTINRRTAVCKHPVSAEESYIGSWQPTSCHCYIFTIILRAASCPDFGTAPCRENRVKPGRCPRQRRVFQFCVCQIDRYSNVMGRNKSEDNAGNKTKDPADDCPAQ